MVKEPYGFESVEEGREQRERGFFVCHFGKLRQDELHADDEEAVERGVNDGGARFAERFFDGCPFLGLEVVVGFAAGGFECVRVENGRSAVGLKDDVLEILVQNLVEE